MKKIKSFLLMLVAAVLLTVQTGCFGEFALTRKVYELNQGISSDIGQQVLFWALNIVPVYEVAVTIDIFILNLIEFWTGSNPLAMNEGDIEQQYVEKDGVTYLITATKNQFHIEAVDSDQGTLDVIFDESTSSWLAQTATETVNLVRFNGNTGSVEFFVGQESFVFNTNLHDLNYMQQTIEEGSIVKR